MNPPVAKIVRSHHLSLNCWHWGDRVNPPVVLVHGGLDHARSWDRVAEALVAAGRYVVAPDLRGHGDSEWAPASGYPMENWVLDLAAVVDAAAIDRCDLVGHSLGGNIAIRYAALFPDRIARLVAIEGLGPSPKMVAETTAKGVVARLTEWIAKSAAIAGRAPRRYASLDDAVARMREANPRLTAAMARHLTEHGLRARDDGGWQWKYDPMVRAWNPVDLGEADRRVLWRAISAPTLLAYGTDSWASNPAEDGRAAQFPTARVATFGGAGHWLHHDAYDAFMAELAGFLEL